MPRWVIQAGSRVEQFPDHFTAQQVTSAMRTIVLQRAEQSLVAAIAEAQAAIRDQVNDG